MSKRTTSIIILSSWALATLAGALVMSHPPAHPVRVVSRPQQAAFDRLDLPDHVDRITLAAPAPRVPSPVAARSVPAVTAPPSTAARPRSPAQVAVGTPQSASMGARWECIRRRESGGDYANRSNPTYRGAYQMSRQAWAAVGGRGDPADASPAEQDARAVALQARFGWGQWSTAGGC